jgi:hypothetical protein
MVITFPRDRCRASTGKIRGAHCSVIILPVVRIERWPEEPTPRRTARKAKTTAKTTAKSKRKTP